VQYLKFKREVLILCIYSPLSFFFLTPLVGSEISVLYFDYINYQGLFITILNKTVNFEYHTWVKDS